MNNIKKSAKSGQAVYCPEQTKTGKMSKKTRKINLKLSDQHLMKDNLHKTIPRTGIQKSKTQQYDHTKQATFSQEVSLNTE